MPISLVRNPLPMVFFTIFIDLLGFGILIPVIPQLLANPTSSFYLLSSSTPLSHGYLLLGLLLASFPLAQFIATPILGQLSDKHGRRKILALSLFGTCVSYMLFAVGIVWKTIPLLFAARILDGITGGNVSVAQAAIADVTTPQNRAKNFGLVGAAFGLGFIIGPFLGGKLSDPALVSWFDATTPFWFAAFLSFLNVLFVFFYFPETLKNAKAGLDLRWHESLVNVKKSWQLKSLRALFGTLFLYNMGFSFFVTFFGVFLLDKFGFSQGGIGDYFAFVGLWIVFSQAIVTRLASKRFTERRTLRVAMLATGVGILLHFLAPAWWMLLVITPPFAAFVGLTQANATSLISRSADANVQGEILGINASLQALSQAIPPVFAGLAASVFSAESPVLIASVMIMVSGIAFIFLSQKMPDRPRFKLGVDWNTS